MVAVSRRFCTLIKRPSILIPKHLFQRVEPNPDQSFIPFSQLQQTKLLEARLVSLLHHCNDLNQIKQLHGHIVRKGLDQCCFVLTKLIRMLTKVGSPMEPYPRLVFQQVKLPNPFLWTALIRGYSIQGLSSESILLYNCMRRDGIGPVSFTFSALLKACTAALDVDLGRQIHAQAIIIGGFALDLYVGNTMIDMYVKCGFLDCGRQVFDEMLERDVISWTSLIVAYAKSSDMKSAAGLFDGLPVKDMVAWTAMVTGFAQNARPREALEYFDKMQDAGIETDEVTLVGVISACAQLGVIKYASWVQDVAEKSGFGPTNNVVIGSALIDMFSKCGSVEDAYKVFDRMTVRNVFSYSSMIVGFAMHGCANAAIQLFHEMVKTETKPNKVTFVGVLTACSHAGMVDHGRHLFATMEKTYGVTPSADLYACMVDLLGRAGCLEEALELVRTMPMDPHGGVWGALLGACRIHANPDIAEIAASHLFELEPNGIGNYILLSNIYASAGKWDDVSRVRKLMRTKGLKKNPGCSWVEGKKGVVHEFFAGDMTHPKSREIKLALLDLVNRLKFHGYQPKLSCVPYDVSDEEKKRILMTHSEKLALGFGLLSTSAGCTIRIVKNLRICDENEDVADSEVEGSTSRLIPHHGDGTKKYIGDAIQTTNNSSVVDLQGQKRFTISSEKEFKDGNMPYGVPFPPQSVNIMNMPYPLDVKESSSFGVPGTSNYPQPGMVQAMAAANSKRPGTQPVMPGNFPVMFGYSPVQLPVLDKDDSWGLASHPQQLHPPFVGRLPPDSDKHNDGLKISQGSFSQAEDGVKGSNMIFGTKEESDKLRAEGFPYELSAIRPGIAAELKFGGCGLSPNLPWVSAKGPGPNGRTISGVTFRYSATQIKIVCACHGSHMSPEEFVRHAGEEQTNPDSGSGLASLPSNNPAASAQS